MRNRVDEILFVGKLSAINILRMIVVLLRQGLRLTCKHCAAKYLTTETIPLRFHVSIITKGPTGFYTPPPPSNTVVDLIKSLCLN